MALGNTVDMFMVKAILAHVGPHQITNRHSAFCPPRPLDGAINAAVIAKRLLTRLVRHDLRPDRTRDIYTLHSAKHLPLAYFG